ncbi:MAG: VOC family protein [Acidimicrobiia bacterium]
MPGVLPGRVRQNGYVVNDLDAALAHWIDVLGVGPWFTIRNLVLDPSEYRGDAVSTEISLAVANSGELQLELIQVHDDSPSCFREFLDEGNEGLHHLAWWTDDFEGTLGQAEAAGWDVIQSGDLMGTRFCYFDTQTHPGTVAELMELNDMSRWLATQAREAADGWDGTTDPVRALG